MENLNKTYLNELAETLFGEAAEEKKADAAKNDGRRKITVVYDKDRENISIETEAVIKDGQRGKVEDSLALMQAAAIVVNSCIPISADRLFSRMVECVVEMSLDKITDKLKNMAEGMEKNVH